MFNGPYGKDEKTHNLCGVTGIRFVANSPILVIKLEWDYFVYIWMNQ